MNDRFHQGGDISERVYITLGIVAWLLALCIGLFMPTITVEQPTSDMPRELADHAGSVVVPSPVSGPLAGGFAIAGGLCFVAGGRAGRNKFTPHLRPVRAVQEERDIEAAVAALERGNPVP